MPNSENQPSDPSKRELFEIAAKATKAALFLELFGVGNFLAACAPTKPSAQPINPTQSPRIDTPTAIPPKPTEAVPPTPEPALDQAIKEKKLEIKKQSQEWEKYFEFVSEDQLSTLYAKAREINPSAYIFPQTDLISQQNLNDITITNEMKIMPTGTAFWAVVLNGLSKDLIFRANYEGETWPSSIATHSVAISGKEGDRNHVLVLPQAPSQPNTLIGDFISRNKPGIKTSLGQPLDYVRTSDKVSEDYLPFSGQAIYYIRKQNPDGTSSYDAKFENAVRTENNKLALLNPGK